VAVNDPIIISTELEATIVQKIEPERTIIVKEIEPKIITHVAERGTTGPGVPTGGSAGQVLSKVDGTSFNTEWVDHSGGIPDAPSDGATYGRKDAGWVAIPTSQNGYFPGGWN
jgi:hypothetical protein